MAPGRDVGTKLKTALAAGALVAAFVSLLHGSGALRGLERWTYDARMKATVPNPPGPDGAVPRAHPDIHLVIISEQSIEVVQQERKIGWPWDRRLFAKLFNATTFEEFPAAAVMFDFFTLRDLDAHGGETELAGVLGEAASPVYVAVSFLSEEFKEADARPGLEELLKKYAIDFETDGSVSIPEENKSVVLPVPGIAEALAGICDVETVEGTDGITRAYRVVSRFRGRYYPSFTLAALMAREKTRSVSVRDGVMTVGAVSFPIGPDGTVLLRFYEPNRSFRIFSAHRVIKGWESFMDRGVVEGFDPSEIDGKFVLMGTDAPALFDLKHTAVSQNSPGVEIHAIALANILNGTLMRAVPAAVPYLVVLGLAALAALATRFTGPLAGGAASAALLGAYVVTDVSLFGARWVMPLLASCLAVALGYAVTSGVNFLYEGRHRRRVKREFQRYVAPQVVEKILRNPAAVRMKGERKELSIFFMDFAGFTAMSEKLDPEELVRLVSEYHNEAAEEIFRTEGTIDKYIGDAIMAYWNEPTDQEDHALRACLAALGAQRRLRELAGRMTEKGLPGMRARIGINTGVATAGDMGAHGQVNYTLIGDEVNLASRLEGVNKEFGTEIIVSEATYRPAKERLEARELAMIIVKGRQQPVRIFELLGIKGEVDAERLEGARHFEKALEAFRARRFDEAWQAFLSAAHRNDRAADPYVAMCERYVSEPPREDWDGSYQMLTK